MVVLTSFLVALVLIFACDVTGDILNSQGEIGKAKIYFALSKILSILVDCAFMIFAAASDLYYNGLAAVGMGFYLISDIIALQGIFSAKDKLPEYLLISPDTENLTSLIYFFLRELGQGALLLTILINVAISFI